MPIRERYPGGSERRKVRERVNASDDEGVYLYEEKVKRSDGVDNDD